MDDVTKHTNILRVLTIVLLVCYAFSFPLFHHPNEIPADLSQIILHLQNSNETFNSKSNFGNTTHSDSIRILKSIAGLNFMQVNTGERDQSSVLVELTTPHLLSANKGFSPLLIQSDPMDFQTLFYISINSPPDIPPPARIFA